MMIIILNEAAMKPVIGKMSEAHEASCEIQRGFPSLELGYFQNMATPPSYTLSIAILLPP